MPTFAGDEGANTINGTDGDDTISGLGGDDALNGLGGNDVLDGGPGLDLTDGGPGDDTHYVDRYDPLTVSGRLFDRVIERPGEGYDRLIVSAYLYQLQPGVEIEHMSGAPVMYGNELGQTIIGDDASGTYHGEGGDDVIDGGLGGDSLSGGLGSDQFVFSWTSTGENVDYIGDYVPETDRIILMGGAGSMFPTLADGALPAEAFTTGAEATSAAHRIIYHDGYLYYDQDGPGRAEALRFARIGGAPTLTASDFQVVASNPPEVIDYNPTEGDDILIGTSGDDVMQGLGGNDVLDGRAGWDSTDGGPGDDRHYVDYSSDVVIERAGEGTDTIYSATAYTLSSATEVEILRTIDDAGTAAIGLTGNESDNAIYGNAGDNYLDGYVGNDTLFGWGGRNTLRGGHGDDTFWVGYGVDVIEEASDQGYDRVYSHSDFTLTPGAHVESLATDDHAGTSPITLIGNEFGQTIYGNRGNNALEGRGGADTLVGGLGDDRYYDPDSLDTIVENDGEGFDSIVVSASYRLPEGAIVEALLINASNSGAPITVTGNSAANSIYGATGADILEGGGGRDYLIGGAGNDQYYADMDDLIIEEASGGFDTVVALADFTLVDGAHVEVLAAGGAGHLHLSGSSFGDSIYGNGGNNILDGWAGADYLTGGGGTDRFRFTFAIGGGEVDTLMDFTSSIDRIELSAAVFGALPMGQLGAGAFVQGSQAADADDRIIHNFDTGALSYDADGSGSGAAVQFAWLQPGTSLQAGDIWAI